jgi:hypothetical protein
VPQHTTPTHNTQRQPITHNANPARNYLDDGGGGVDRGRGGSLWWEIVSKTCTNLGDMDTYRKKKTTMSDKANMIKERSTKKKKKKKTHPL